MDPTVGLFEAGASALGYVHQIRYALVRALEQLRIDVNWTIMIEGADDVELVDQEHRELSQLKLRQPGTSLTDADPDLWKTLRIWATGIKDGTIDPQSTSLYLLTTASAPTGSIAAILSPDPNKRDLA